MSVDVKSSRYLGLTMNILFLCTSNLNRSKTAEHHFSKVDFNNHYRSAGLSKRECERHNTTLCNDKLLEWADKIFVMEAEHIRRIEEHTGTKYLEKIISLDIPDQYKYGEIELVCLLESRLKALK